MLHELARFVTLGAMMSALPIAWYVGLLLAVASFAAGFVDAIVGGGGLITMPALLLGFPASANNSALVFQLMGTNKVAACTGTTVAAFRFWRSGNHSLRQLLLPIGLAMSGAVGGYYTFQWLGKRSTAFLQPTMVVIMVLLLLFTALRPSLGQVHAPRFGKRHQFVLLCLFSIILGFYDGFFGPGAGSLLIFLFVAVLGFDFLRASGTAKFVNWGSNIAGVTLFVSHGQWMPLLALLLAVTNALGGWLGARFALSKGTRLVRRLFVIVVAGLIVSLAIKWIWQ